MDVFLELVLILVVVKLFGYFIVCFGFLVVFGQFIGGIFIGFFIFGIVFYDEVVRFIGEFGVVMFFFLVGFEMDIEEFKYVGIFVFIVVVMGVFVFFFFGYFGVFVWGYLYVQVFFFGGIFMVMSVGLIIRYFDGDEEVKDKGWDNDFSCCCS